MEFAQRVKDLSVRSRHAAQHALTEEATKTSVVMPFIQTLGFDVFNLNEVVPDFIADVGIKKGEKIDFALKIDGKISVLVEAKPITASLGSTQFSQLYRYFATLETRLAILTNGREIWFFSDIDEKNRMDKKPFFVFDLQSHDDGQINELARFQKSGFDIESILEAASNLKYVKAAANFLTNQLLKPDDEFVKLVARQIYEGGSITKNVVEQLRPAIASALDEVIRNRIQEKLNVTFRADSGSTEQAVPASNLEDVNGDEIFTSEDESRAFFIVQAIGARIAPVSRITMRDAKSYCAVFVDDKNNRPVCRFYSNAKGIHRIGVFDTTKSETKHQIETLSDIYQHAAAIEAVITRYIK